MSTDTLSLCANCGKGEESSGELKLCTACKMVKYCSRDCQKAHRPQHKKECKKRAAELHDEALFEQPPPQLEDFPICFMRMPSLHTGRRFKSCCGKFICSGCVHAVQITRPDSHDIPICPFCRTPTPMSDEKIMDMLKNLMEVGDAQAICNCGCHYAEGSYGLTKDWEKALELWHQAGELGCTKAYYSIGIAYCNGNGVERDEKKATHYWELAAMGGDENARHNLGAYENNAGNFGRAIKHYMIAVGCGDNLSLNKIKQLYSKGNATKDDYAKSLKAYQAYLDDIKSDDRDKAAAFSDDFKYYE